MTGDPSCMGAVKGSCMPSGGVGTRTSSTVVEDNYPLGLILPDLCPQVEGSGERHIVTAPSMVGTGHQRLPPSGAWSNKTRRGAGG